MSTEALLKDFPTRVFYPDYINSYGNLRNCGLSSFKIKSNISSCMKCPLSSYEKPLSLNIKHKSLMVIGETPKDVMFEEENGILLSNVLREFSFNIEDIYFTSAVKCLSSNEFKKCNSHLIGELLSVNPLVILSLGYNAGLSIVDSISGPGHHETLPTGQDFLVTYSVSDVLSNSLYASDFKKHIKLIKDQLIYRVNQKGGCISYV